MLLLLALCLPYFGYAQFNDSTHYYTSYLSSGSINKTNNSTAYLLNNGFKFNIRQKSVALNFTNNWIYGQQNSVLTNNDFSSSLDFNFYQTKRFYYWGLVNYNTSYSLKINNQLLAGAGIAYSFIDNKNAYINISDGLLYDQSGLALNDNNEHNNYHTTRNSLRLTYHFKIKNIIILDGSNFLQNSLDYGSDYIIRSVTTLSFKLNKWLSLTSSLSYNRQNRTDSENLLFTYGLTAEKYF